jgi:hypothetical protein
MLRKLDTPRHILARRERTHRSRQRLKAGRRCWTLELPDETVEVMIDDLIRAGRLNSSEAIDPHRVAAELARQLLLLWSDHRTDIR